MKPPKAPAVFVGKGLLIPPEATLIEAKTALYEEGFEYLGGGACAAAFGHHPTGRVVKLVCGDSGHLLAVETFQRFSRIKAFPRIYGLVTLAEGAFAYETEWCLESDAYYADGWSSRTGRALDRLSEARWGCEDFHEHNIMERPDGDIVIVDPFHEGDSSADRADLFSEDATGYEVCADDLWANVGHLARYRKSQAGELQIELPLAA